MKQPVVEGFDPEMFNFYANPPTFEGTDLKIVEFPSRILRDENTPIVDFDDKLAELCKEMFSVMYAAKGVGIAAPQVGLNLKLFVYNTDPSAPGMLRRMGEHVVVNPKIVQYCQRTETDIEGCLSSRAECCRGDICRAYEIDVEYQDERGRLKQKKLRGFEARVFQHEFDHINGVLHIDRQSPADRVRIQPFLDVLIDEHGPGGVLTPDPVVLASLPPVVGAEPEQKAAAAAAAATPAPARQKAGAVASSNGFGGAAKTKGFGAGGGAGAAKPKKKKKR